MDEQVHNWGPLDLVDDDFNQELDSFHLSEREAEAKKQQSATATTARDFFELKNRKRIFKAWLEEWEKEHIHNSSTESEHHLLEKHHDMHAFIPEDGGSFHQVCGHKLQWIVEKAKKHGQDKTEGCPGWSLILVPKGQDFSSDQMANYHSMCFNANDIHTCIGICQQEDSCVVLKPEDSPVNDMGDRIQFFNENFRPKLNSEKHFREWDDEK